MKIGKPFRRWMAEQWCAGDHSSMQMSDVSRITRVIKELMDLLQAENTYDYKLYDYTMVEYEMGLLKKELGSWFIEDFELFIGS